MMTTNPLGATMTQALAPFMQHLTPPMGTLEFCAAMRRWSRSNPSHSELAGVLFLLASAAKTNGALSDKCKHSVVDQLQELANEVEQDAVNQQAEQT